MVKSDGAASKKEREKKKRAEARNPNKFKDFKKVKQKVGAKKRGPVNQTSTALKVKRTCARARGRASDSRSSSPTHRRKHTHTTRRRGAQTST